jgi:hypothetical protein
MEAVAKLGHEVGYHYEDYSLARGDRGKALALFEKHLAMLRRHADIRTITMHGSPLSPFDNREIWQDREYRRFGIEADAFLDIDYRGMPYFTDTGRRWDARASNLRDWPPGALASPAGIRTTEDLMRHLGEIRVPSVAIAAHPERWDAGFAGWCTQALKDLGINAAKMILRLARRR